MADTANVNTRDNIIDIDGADYQGKRYRVIEIKGTTYYARMNPDMKYDIPFQSVYERNVSMDERNNYLEACEIGLRINDICRQEISKTLGGTVNGVTYQQDPNYASKSSDRDYYYFRIYAHWMDNYDGVESNTGFSNGLSEGIVWINLRELFNRFYGGDFNRFKLECNLQLGGVRPFEGLLTTQFRDTILTIETREANFSCSASSREYLNYSGFGSGYINFGGYRSVEFEGKLFCFETIFSMNTNVMPGFYFHVGGETYEFRIDEYGDFTMDANIRYWNEECSMYLESA